MQLANPTFPKACLILGFLLLQISNIESFSLSAIGSAINAATRHRNYHGRQYKLSMSTAAGSTDLTGTVVGENLKGKFVAQRRIYRLSPTESTVQTPYTIEERQYYSVNNSNALQPHGDKRVIFRNGKAGKSENIDLGTVLHSVDGMTGDDQKADSSYAMALYFMQHPEILTGKGLEVGSGVGIGGILSVIGAGITSGSGGAATFYASTPVPSALSRITMTDSRENLLSQCPENLSASDFPVSNVQLGLLDWNKPVQSDLTNQCNFVIGCDCAHQYPSVNPLAKTLAYALTSSGGKLLYIGPKQNQSIQDLQRELKLGYRINTSMSEIALDRIELIPQIVNSIDDDVQGENGGSVEYQKIDTSRYSAIVGFHHEEYDGTNGDVFFPAEGGIAIQEATAQEESVAQKKQSASVDSDDSPVGTVNGGGSSSAFDVSPSNVSDDVARVRSVYLDWCKQYGKEPDEFRFSTFLFNYLAMESHAKENARNLQLNEYYDCTEEEYIALTIGKASEDSKKDNTAGNVKAKEGARVAEEKAEALRMKEEGDRLAAVAAESARLEKEEEDRLTAEAAAEAARFEKEEERLAAEAARLEKEKEEKERLAAEAAAEAARVEKEKEEEERLAAEAAAEAARLEKEKEEEERLAAEAAAEAARLQKEEEERLAAEAAAEAARLQKEEEERLAAESAEAARLEKEEEERLAAEAAAEAARLEKEEEERVAAEAARLEKEEQERFIMEAAKNKEARLAAEEKAAVARQEREAAEAALKKHLAGMVEMKQRSILEKRIQIEAVEKVMAEAAEKAKQMASLLSTAEKEKLAAESEAKLEKDARSAMESELKNQKKGRISAEARLDAIAKDLKKAEKALKTKNAKKAEGEPKGFARTNKGKGTGDGKKKIRNDSGDKAMAEAKEEAAQAALALSAEKEKRLVAKSEAKLAKEARIAIEVDLENEQKGRISAEAKLEAIARDFKKAKEALDNKIVKLAETEKKELGNVMQAQALVAAQKKMESSIAEMKQRLILEKKIQIETVEKVMFKAKEKSKAAAKAISKTKAEEERRLAAEEAAKREKEASVAIKVDLKKEQEARAAAQAKSAEEESARTAAEAKVAAVLKDLQDAQDRFANAEEKAVAAAAVEVDLKKEQEARAAAQAKSAEEESARTAAEAKVAAVLKDLQDAQDRLADAEEKAVAAAAVEVDLKKEQEARAAAQAKSAEEESARTAAEAKVAAVLKDLQEAKESMKIKDVKLAVAEKKASVAEESEALAAAEQALLSDMADIAEMKQRSLLEKRIQIETVEKVMADAAEKAEAAAQAIATAKAEEEKRLVFEEEATKEKEARAAIEAHLDKEREARKMAESRIEAMLEEFKESQEAFNSEVKAKSESEAKLFLATVAETKEKAWEEGKAAALAEAKETAVADIAKMEETQKKAILAAEEKLEEQRLAAEAKINAAAAEVEAAKAMFISEKQARLLAESRADEKEKLKQVAIKQLEEEKKARQEAEETGLRLQAEVENLAKGGAEGANPRNGTNFNESTTEVEATEREMLRDRGMSQKGTAAKKVRTNDGIKLVKQTQKGVAQLLQTVEDITSKAKFITDSEVKSGDSPKSIADIDPELDAEVAEALRVAEGVISSPGTTEETLKTPVNASSTDASIDLNAEEEKKLAFESKTKADADKKAAYARKAKAEAEAKKAAEARAKAEAEAKKAVEAKKAKAEADKKVADARKVEEARKAKEEAEKWARVAEKEKQVRQAEQEKAAAKAVAEAESAAIAAAKETAEREAAQIAKRRELDALAAEKERKKAQEEAKKISAKTKQSSVKPIIKEDIEVTNLAESREDTGAIEEFLPSKSLKTDQKKPAVSSPFANIFGVGKKNVVGKEKEVPKVSNVKEVVDEATQALETTDEKEKETPEKDAARMTFGNIFSVPKTAKLASKSVSSEKEVIAPPPSLTEPISAERTVDNEVKDSVSDAFASFFKTKPSTPKKKQDTSQKSNLSSTPQVTEKSKSFSIFGGTKTSTADKSETAPDADVESTPTTAPSTFKFFGGVANPSPKPKPEASPAPVTPPPQPKAKSFNFFDTGSKAKPKVPPVKKAVPAKKPAPVMKRGTISLGNSAPVKDDGIPLLSNWQQAADGAVTGNISNSKMFRDGEKITTSPVKRGAKAGTVVTTSSGSKYRLSEQTKIQPKPPSTGPKTSTFNLFNTGSKATVKPVVKKSAPVMKKSAPLRNRGTISLGSTAVPKNDGIPILSNWTQGADGTVTGNISNSKMFRNGQRITTSPVKRGAKAGTVVTTSSGSKYRLS